MIVKRLERERQLRREKGYLSSRENDQVGDDATECKHKCKTVMFVRNKVFRNGVFWNNERSYFLSRTSNFIDDE